MKDDLHELIHALSQAEKRYFRVFAGKGGGKSDANYVRLFDAIAAMDSFEDEKLRRIFKGEPIEKNLPSEKNYLFRLILKAMRGFHAERSISTQLHNLMLDMHFLKSKDMQGPHAKLLKKALQLAAKQEKLGLQLELLDEQRALLKQQNLGLRPLDILEGTESVLKKAKQLLESWSLFYNMLELMNQNETHVESEQKPVIQEILNNSLPKLGDEGKSFYSEIYALMTKAIGYHVLGQAKEAKEMYEQILQKWESDPDFLEDDKFGYINSMSNYLNLCYFTGDALDLEKSLDKLRKIPTDNLREGKRKFIALASNGMRFHLSLFDFENCKRDALELEAGLKMYSPFISAPTVISFRFNMFIIYFLTGERRRALELLNQIIHESEDNHRTDIQDASRLLLLLMHIDLGNFDILEYMARSVYRYFKKEDRLDAFTKTIIKLAESSVSDAERPKLYSQKLNALLKHPADEKAQVGMELSIVWLIGKVKGISLQEAYEINNRSEYK